VEVETTTLAQVKEALSCQVDIIMLDNFPLDQLAVAVQQIRQAQPHIKIEASGNVTLDRLHPSQPLALTTSPAALRLLVQPG
jgi:nicotinate-nucleotide pyrophosphorylase (carboxylating)